MTAEALVKGWCPGALRPMQSGDGLIARLRITGGIVDPDLAQRIAAWSRRWGNGLIDISNRANLQLRGISGAHLPDLHGAMSASGVLDRSAAAEAVRNVIASPLAGLDPAAVMDIRTVVGALEQRLADDASLHVLPGKFGFAVDDDGVAGLEGVPADIRFVARRSDDGPVFAVHLAGAAYAYLGWCRPDGLPEMAATLCHLFLRYRAGRETAVRRMRDLVVREGVAALAAEAGLRCFQTGEVARPVAFLGAHSLGSGAFVGVGLPFGRVSAEDFAALAVAAAEHSAASLRLTPWRAILVPVRSFAAARSLSAQLAAFGFILDPEDPRCRIAACPGAPACARGTTPVRDDAAALAVALGGVRGSRIVLHVSGCEKGCAHPGEAAITLVARAGRYDLVRDGPASGAAVARNLTLQQVVAYGVGL
jgi:precorrin-3B synthase